MGWIDVTGKLYLDSLRRISGVLGRPPSLAYAFAYLLLIPAFALVYWWFLPDQFFHTTAQYEPVMISASREVGRVIANEILRSSSDSTTYHWKVSRRRFIPRQIYVSGISLNGDRLTGLLQAELDPVAVFRHEKITLVTRIAVCLDPLFVEGSSRERFECKQVRLMPLGAFVPYLDDSTYTLATHALFPYRAPFLYDSVLVLPVSSQSDYDLQRYVLGARGLPFAIKGSFWRFLYFSVVTITTLGLGDIVPTSSFARLLVGSEAVLGVLLVGLFLNALAHETGPR
jgi:hypothetical protein